MDDWHPMDTLPRDGSWFRGLDTDSGKEADMRWSDGHDAVFRDRDGNVAAPDRWRPLTADRARTGN